MSRLDFIRQWFYLFLMFWKQQQQQQVLLVSLLEK